MVQIERRQAVSSCRSIALVRHCYTAASVSLPTAEFLRPTFFLTMSKKVVDFSR